MAQISFRHGIVRIHGAAIQFTAGNTAILLNALSGPVTYTIADGKDDDYLYEEAGTVDPAWTDLPSVGQYWLYSDLNSITGERTFGTSVYQPIDDVSAPNNPAQDQHWFDTRPSRTVMKVWNGQRWVEVIRIFLAKVQGASIQQFATGSQIGYNTPVRAGKLLFDDDANTKPIKRFDRRGRGKFITTESTIFSNFSNITGFRPEQAVVDGRASEPIGQYQCLAFHSTKPRTIRLARNTDPDFPCIGIASEQYGTGQVKSFITTGYLSDDNFALKVPTVDFDLSPGTLVFVNDNGQLTTDVPQTFSIQTVARLVDPFTIFVDIQHIIIYG